MKFFPQLSHYFRAKRLYRTITFLHTLLGYIAVKGFVFSNEGLVSLAIVTFTFGILFHGGIYAINNIADRKTDARSRRKHKRVVASGIIDHRWLLFDAVVSILIAFALTWNFTPGLLWFMALFLAINFFYTFVLKSWSLLGGALFVSTTHALRFMLGVFIAGGDVWRYWPLYVLVWIGQTSIATRKIQFERRRYETIVLRVIRISIAVVLVVLGCISLGYKVPLVVVLAYWINYLGGYILYHFSPMGRKAIQTHWQQS